uniref:SWIM-type domain-containing protein n=1 Tax=Trichobilharzia regenti TaxID=157069 RepID=A0AA85KDY1_TRIRE|nr:unnamed protein product [Trichobilharzia regenti]
MTRSIRKQFNVYNMYRTSIVFILLIIYFRSLNLGSCTLNGGDVYCQQYRRDSFCSLLQDECFCLPGYVSVNEMDDSWYTCKPLITDLYCRMDLECAHISGSICHPGVGACVCPSGYEFVLQQFACLPRINDNRNSLCTACQRSGGICVMNKTDYPMNNYQSELQCACPRRRMSNKMERSSFDICHLTSADIGEECNVQGRRCLSQNAICVQTTTVQQSVDNRLQLMRNKTVNICQCFDGMIPVYQKNLDYFECFTEVSDPTILDCQSCFQSHGRCYQINSGLTDITNIQYGCTCPLFQQHLLNSSGEYLCESSSCTHEKEIKFNKNIEKYHYILPDQFRRAKQFTKLLKKNKNFCTESFIQVTCDRQSISVCYKHPYKISDPVPYNDTASTFKVYLKSTMIYPEFIATKFNVSMSRSIPQSCLLKQTGDQTFCSTFNVQLNQFKKCEIYEIVYKDGSAYYGTLHAEDKKEGDSISMLRNFHIDFLCFNEGKSKMSTTYFYDRSFSSQFFERNHQVILYESKNETNTVSAMKYVKHGPTNKVSLTTFTNSDSIPLSISSDLSNQLFLTLIRLKENDIRLEIISAVSKNILIEYCLIDGVFNSSSRKLPTSDNENHHRVRCLNMHISYRINTTHNGFNYQCILFERNNYDNNQEKDSFNWTSEPMNLQNFLLHKHSQITCLIRVCKIPKYCTYANLYSSQETLAEQNDLNIPSNLYIPLILWNSNNIDRIQDQYGVLFPPGNLADFIQFYFIQTKLETNYTTDKSSDVKSHVKYADMNHSEVFNWMKYILGILIFIFICQTSMIMVTSIKKIYIRYKLKDAFSPLAAVNTRKFENPMMIRRIHSNDNNHTHEIERIHSAINQGNSGCKLNVELNANHRFDPLHNDTMDIIIKPKQTRHSTTCLVISPSYSQHDCRQLISGFNTHHHHHHHRRLACASCHSNHENHRFPHQPNDVHESTKYPTQYTTTSLHLKHQNDNNTITKSVCESTLDTSYNQIQMSTEYLKQNKQNYLLDNNYVENYSSQTIPHPINYKHDPLKQRQHVKCPIYYSLRNQNYKDGWV